MKQLALCILLLIALAAASATRVALFAYPGGPSHGFIVVAFAVELQRRGHEPTIFAFEHDLEVVREKFRSLGGEDSTVAWVTHAVKAPDAMRSLGMELPDAELTRPKLAEFWQRIALENDAVKSLIPIATVAQEMCASALRTPALREELSRAEFVVADWSYQCAWIAAGLHGLPLLWYSPVGLLPPLIPLGHSPAAYVPTIGSRFTDEMGLIAATKNWLNGLAVKWILNPMVLRPIICKYVIHPFNVSQALGHNMRSCSAVVHDLLGRTGIKLILSEIDFEFPRDVATGVSFVGHPLSHPAAPIADQLISDFVESDGTTGFVLISLGHYGSWDNVNKTLQVARALDDGLPPGVRVLWKVSTVTDKEALAGIPSSRFKVVEWMPQNDLLGHPNCRVFVTHGGMNSVQEASYHGVPIVGTAMLGDQFDNLARAVRHGYGQVLDHRTFGATDLLASVVAALEDPEYARAATRMAARLRANPRSAVERAVDMIEYGIATGGAPYLNRRERSIAGSELPWLAAPAVLGTVAIALLIFATVLILWIAVACSRSLCQSVARKMMPSAGLREKKD